LYDNMIAFGASLNGTPGITAAQSPGRARVDDSDQHRARVGCDSLNTSFRSPMANNRKLPFPWARGPSNLIASEQPSSKDTGPHLTRHAGQGLGGLGEGDVGEWWLGCARDFGGEEGVAAGAGVAAEFHGFVEECGGVTDQWQGGDWAFIDE
jgi:hypothetical protein